MFAKVYDGSGMTIHECTRAGLEDIVVGDDRARYCVLHLIENGVGVDLRLDKAKSAVYFMSDGGKTIDSYQWSGIARRVAEEEKQA